MIMKNKILILLLLPALLVGCGGSKKAQQSQLASQPEWVKGRPSSPSYYYGIGAARKTLDVSQYQQAARQNAMADMAGEISTSISSNSVLHAFESNLNFREDFSSTIRAQTQQDLEGYELVSSWEDAENYWVFYSLSKAHHKEIIEKRKNDAVSRSLDFFVSGLNTRDGGNIRIATVQLIKSLEPIKPYFGESLPVEYHGQQIFLGNEIFKQISETITQVEITPQSNITTVKTGRGLIPSQLQFNTQYRVVGSVADIPLVATYSEKPIRNNKQRSDSEGRASFEVDVVRSTKNFETFTATLDVDDLLNEAGADPFIRKLITRFNLPKGVIRVDIEKPSFAIIASEVLLGEVQKPGLLEENFRKKAIDAGFIIKDNAKDADFIVRINAVASPGNDGGQFKNVNLEGLIIVETNQGNSIYHRPLSGFYGRHFDHKQAGLEAFREVQRKLDITYFREIQEALNRR